MAEGFGSALVPRAEDDMPNLSGTLTIELALLMAIVSPCSSDGGFASLSHSRSVSNNQQFVLAGTREHSTNAAVTSRPDDGAEGTDGQSGFPGELSAVGITSLALIFHPYHLKEYEMTCEPENWQGHPAWKVHFEQRLDQPARMSA